MYSVVAKCALRLLHRVANSNVVPRRWWGRLPNAVAVAAPVRSTLLTISIARLVSCMQTHVWKLNTTHSLSTPRLRVICRGAEGVRQCVGDSSA